MRESQLGTSSLCHTNPFLHAVENVQSRLGQGGRVGGGGHPGDLAVARLADPHDARMVAAPAGEPRRRAQCGRRVDQTFGDQKSRSVDERVLVELEGLLKRNAPGDGGHVEGLTAFPVPGRRRLVPRLGRDVAPERLRTGIRPRVRQVGAADVVEGALKPLDRAPIDAGGVGDVGVDAHGSPDGRERVGCREGGVDGPLQGVLKDGKVVLQVVDVTPQHGLEEICLVVGRLWRFAEPETRLEAAVVLGRKMLADLHHALADDVGGLGGIVVDDHVGPVAEAVDHGVIGVRHQTF